MHILNHPHLAMFFVCLACDPIGMPDQDDCVVDEQAFFTNSNQLDFELDLNEDERSLVSFTLRNDACRNVRFNYLTDVYGTDAQAFHVQPPPEGYEPWIATSNAVEVTVEFSPQQPGLYQNAWIQIEYSYPEEEGNNAVGEMDRIFLRGNAIQAAAEEP
jgi:hypothetical protein